MCLICIEFQRLTVVEAANNLGEMVPDLSEEHLQEVAYKLFEEVWENFGDVEFVAKNGGEEVLENSLKKISKYLK